MITTDYMNLINEDTRPRFLHSMEGLTGSSAAYGDTTPIRVVDVLDKIGLSTAIRCFDAATQDVSSLRKTLGLEFLRPFLVYFNELTGNTDSRIIDLINLGELYLSSKGEGSAPARLDYCGDPIDAVGTITPTQIAGKQQALAASYASLPETHLSTAFGVVCLSSITNQGGSGDGLSRPPGLLDTAGIGGGPVQTIVDPAQVPLPFTKRGYLEAPIAQEIKNGNMAAESNDFYQRGLSSGQGLVWTLADIGALSGRGPDALTPIPFYKNIAIKYFAKATTLAVNQVLYGDSNLDTIAELIQQAVVNYAEYKAEPLPSVIYNLRCMASNSYGGTPLMVVPGAEDVSARIIAAGETKKYNLLTSATFLAQFDLDYSQGLNANERYNAEIAIQQKTLEARAGQAQIEFQKAQDSYFFLKSLFADVSSIFRLYII